LEHETLICPFCGAPRREHIPSGTVQVKCKYCNGIILVPPSLGGEVQRCPNHPEVLAAGLCNDCGKSFCDGCLYLSKIKGATLYLCPDCFRKREAKETTVVLILGVFCILLGFFLIFIPTVDTAMRGIILFVFGFPAVTWGIYRRSHLPKRASLKERRKAVSVYGKA